MFIQYLSDKYIQSFIFYLNFNIIYDLSEGYELFSERVPTKLELSSRSSPLIRFLKIINYNRLIRYLPKYLKELTMSNDFNHPIKYSIKLRNGNTKTFSLFSKLKILKFGWNFNQIIDNHLPIELKVLELGHNFRQSVSKLPPNLEELEIDIILINLFQNYRNH